MPERFFITVNIPGARRPCMEEVEGEFAFEVRGFRFYTHGHCRLMSDALCGGLVCRRHENETKKKFIKRARQLITNDFQKYINRAKQVKRSVPVTWGKQ